MRAAARAVYAVFAVLAIGLSLVALADPSRALPPDAATPLTEHLVREEAAAGVFVGLMALWCLFHFESRRPVHLALLVFAALFSAIHWLEYAHGRRGIASPLINSVPLAALLATAPYGREPLVEGRHDA
jgi:hypothetical protein